MIACGRDRTDEIAAAACIHQVPMPPTGTIPTLACFEAKLTCVKLNHTAGNESASSVQFLNSNVQSQAQPYSPSSSLASLLCCGTII